MSGEKSTMQFKRNTDLATPMTVDRDAAVTDRLLGTWTNSNAESRGFERLVIDRADAGMGLRAFGIGDDGPVDWGRVRADVFANLEDEGVTGTALYARYDLGYMEVEIQLRLPKGLLVITHFAKFKDDSGRTNWVDREFFYRAVDA